MEISNSVPLFTMKAIIHLPSRAMVLTPLLLWLMADWRPAGAREFTAHEVRTAVHTWVRLVTTDPRPDAEIEALEPDTVDGRTVAYIAHLSGGGYCLCGANDSVLPVYLYCLSGDYRADHPGCRCVLAEIAERTRVLNRQALPRSAAVQALLSQRAVLWRHLLAGTLPPRVRLQTASSGPPDRIDLPLTSHWGQDSPYNDRCPQLTPASDEYCAVGCNAIAAGQLMYYWKWPPSGTGQTNVTYQWRYRTTWDEQPLSVNPGIPAGPLWLGRLEWTAASGGRLRMNGYWDRGVHDNAKGIAPNGPLYQQALETLYNRLTPGSTRHSANFANTTYDWSLMQDIHSDPVDAGDQAVATFCRHVAIAYHSDFGYTASTLSEFYTYPFTEHFRYDPDAMDTTYTDLALMAEDIIEELQWLRPVGEAVTLDLGNGARGGHSLVIRGYDKKNHPNPQFHVNFGWGPPNTNWLSLDEISLTDGYHNIVSRIAPKDTVKFVGHTPGDGSPADPYGGIEFAAANAPNGATLIFKAGSIHTFAAATLRIARPLTLKGINVTIRRQ